MEVDMNANDNTRPSRQPPAPRVPTIASIATGSFSPGFNLRAAAAALRPKPQLRLVTAEL